MSNAKGVTIGFEDLTMEERKALQRRALQEKKPLKHVIIDVIRERALSISEQEAESNGD